MYVWDNAEPVFVNSFFVCVCRTGHQNGFLVSERGVGRGGGGGGGGEDGKKKYLDLSISLSRVIFVDSRETLQGCWEAIAKVSS